jgi:hypothetical protein
MTQLTLFDLPEDKPTIVSTELGRLVNGAWVEPVTCQVCGDTYQNPYIFSMNCGSNVPAAPPGVCFGLWWKKYRFGNRDVAA